MKLDGPHNHQYILKPVTGEARVGLLFLYFLVVSKNPAGHYQQAHVKRYSQI